MSVLQFLASLVSSLAWPITVIVLVYLLRVPLKQILLTLTHLKYKDLELDFGRELKQLEQEAIAIDIAPRQQKKVTAHLQTEKGSMGLIEEAIHMSNDFPEAAITVAWQAVEAELMAAVMRLGLSADYPPHNSALKNAELLREQGAIDSNIFDLLNRIRTLRNTVIHSTERGAISIDEAERFIALAWGLVERLEQLNRN